MALLSPKKYPIKIFPVHAIESSRNVKIQINSGDSQTKLVTAKDRKDMLIKKCKILYAVLILSIMQYGIGIVIYTLSVSKPHKKYTINELTWIPYLIGTSCIHIPLSICICKLEPNVHGLCDYLRFLEDTFTK